MLRIRGVPFYQQQSLPNIHIDFIAQEKIFQNHIYYLRNRTKKHHRSYKENTKSDSTIEIFNLNCMCQ